MTYKTFDQLNEAEKDSRLTLIQALLNCPHGDYRLMWQKHAEVASADPMFYAHAAAWYRKNGKIRDHNLLFAGGLLMQNDSVFRSAGSNLLGKLAPYQAKALSEFVSKTLKRKPSYFRKAMLDYTVALVSDEGRLEGAVLKMRRAVQALVWSYHVRTTPKQHAMIFADKDVKLDGRLGAVKQLAEATSDEQRAALIAVHKIPFTTAVGALGEDGMTPKTLRALIEVATPQEVLNLARRLEAYNAYADAKVQDLVAQKLQAAAGDSRVNMAKLSQATSAVKDTSVKSAIAKAQQKVIETQLAVGGTWAVFGDVSGSMNVTIGMMAKVLSLMCAAMTTEPVAYWVNDMATPVKFPKDKTFEAFQEAFKYTRANGNTALGAGLKKLTKPVDGIVIITDEGDNTSPMFGDGLRDYEKKFGHYPPVIVVRVKADSRQVQVQCKQLGVECTPFDYTGDYNELNNLLALMKPGARWRLLEEIYATPLP